MTPTIGVLGIGSMGLPMAARLHQAGLDVTAADLNGKQVSRARELGLMASTDMGFLGDREILTILVATPPQLMDLLKTDLLTDGRTRTLVVMSTVGVAVMREFTSQAQRYSSISIVDCPITGGVAGAQAGTLTLFAAGNTDVTAALATTFISLGTVRTCGNEPGCGQAVKLVNQVLAAGNMAVAAEALALAKALGLAPASVLPLVESGAGTSWMLKDRGPRMVQDPENRPAQTHVSIFAKDAALVTAVASEVGIRLPLADAAANLFARAAEQDPRADDSSVIDAIVRVPPVHERIEL